MKPQPERELAVEAAFEYDYQIVFYASPNALEDIKSFGRVVPWSSDEKYWLYVDRRYNFREVLTYMESYG